MAVARAIENPVSVLRNQLNRLSSAPRKIAYFPRCCVKKKIVSR